MIQTSADVQPARTKTASSVNPRASGFSNAESALMGLDFVLFALWLGGLIVIGAIVAPIAFSAIRHASALAGLASTQNTLAGQIVGGSLRVFNYVAAPAGAWLTVRIWLISRKSILGLSRSIGGSLATTAPAALALFITVFQAAVLFPLLDGAQAAGHMADFDRLHRLYELLSEFQMLLLVALAFVYGRLCSGRMAS